MFAMLTLVIVAVRGSSAHELEIVSWVAGNVQDDSWRTPAHNHDVVVEQYCLTCSRISALTAVSLVEADVLKLGKDCGRLSY